MNRSVWGGIVAVALVGCAGQSVAPEAVSAGTDAQNEAASYARSSVKDVYRSLRRGKVDLSQSLLAEDAFVLGPGPGNVYTNRTDAVLAVTSEFEAGDRERVRSKGLVAEGAVTGKSAWVVDRIDIARRRYTVVAVFAELDEIWYVVALNIGATTPVASDAKPAKLAGGVRNGADEVVEIVRAGGASPLAFLDQLSDRKKVTVMGPGRNDHLRGPRTIQRRWKRKRKSDAPDPFALVGDVRAGVTPDGGVAWVAAYARTGDAEDAPLQRMMFVYERAGDDWRLVAMQTSEL